MTVDLRIPITIHLLMLKFLNFINYIKIETRGRIITTAIIASSIWKKLKFPLEFRVNMCRISCYVSGFNINFAKSDTPINLIALSFELIPVYFLGGLSEIDSIGVVISRHFHE